MNILELFYSDDGSRVERIGMLLSYYTLITFKVEHFNWVRHTTDVLLLLKGQNVHPLKQVVHGMKETCNNNMGRLLQKIWNKGIQF